MTTDPQRIQEIIQQRMAAGVSRQEIIFELERLGLTRAEANEQIDRSGGARPGIRINGQPMEGGGARDTNERPRRGDDGYEPPFYKRPRTLASLGITLLIAAFFAYNSFFSGPTDEDRIKDLNEAALTNARSDGKTGKTNILNLRTGDCLDAGFLSGDLDNIQDANRVACDSTDAAYLITSQELLSDPENASYPGIAYFDSIAQTRCPDNFAIYLFPTNDSWELGDRVVTCIGTT